MAVILSLKTACLSLSSDLDRLNSVTALHSDFSSEEEDDEDGAGDESEVLLASASLTLLSTLTSLA